MGQNIIGPIFMHVLLFFMLQYALLVSWQENSAIIQENTPE